MGLFTPVSRNEYPVGTYFLINSFIFIYPPAFDEEETYWYLLFEKYFYLLSSSW
jgi:hypothetical protein